MFTRRDVLIGGGAVAAVSAVGLEAAAAPAIPGRPDRVLQLKLSDKFASQTWTSAGQTWTEAKQRLTLFVDETVEISILNDLGEDRFVTWGSDLMCRRVKRGDTTKLSFHVAMNRNYDVGLLSDRGPEFMLAADVRPNSGRTRKPG